MLTQRFVDFYSAVQWLVHGESITTLRPKQFYIGKVCSDPDVPPNGFKQVEDLDPMGLGVLGAAQLAEEMLLDAIAAGKLTLIGTNRENVNEAHVPNFLQTIEPSFVAAASFQYDVDGAELYDDEITLTHLHVSFAELLTVFSYRKRECQDESGAPPNAQPSVERVKLHAAAVGECERYLEQFTRDKPTPIPKAEVRQSALNHIPGLSARGFDRAWHKVVPPNWKTAGRKSKR